MDIARPIGPPTRRPTGGFHADATQSACQLHRRHALRHDPACLFQRVAQMNRALTVCFEMNFAACPQAHHDALCQGRDRWALHPQTSIVDGIRNSPPLGRVINGDDGSAGLLSQKMQLRQSPIDLVIGAVDIDQLPVAGIERARISHCRNVIQANTGWIVETRLRPHPCPVIGAVPSPAG